MKLTKSQRTALLILDARGEWTLPSTTNAPPERGDYVALGSVRVLVDHGLAEWRSERLIGSEYRITTAGRELAASLREDG